MVQIITPYVNNDEIKEHKNQFWDLDIAYEQDVAGIGSDLMFQRMWKKFPQDDIFILHSDMQPITSDWLENVQHYVDKYPEAGIFGCLLLYPATSPAGKHYVQSAGGKFVNGLPEHYGSGLILETMQLFKQPEEDNNQYDNVREVAWTTFGGCYIRREVLNAIGDFSPEYEWTYNRDVDYCLRARQQGFKIYQLPIRLLHHESKENKIIKATNPAKSAMEARNLARLQNKWKNSDFYKTIDIIVENE